MLGREHARTAGRRAAELERGLDRLGAGAREEDAAETPRRAPQQLLREQRRQRARAELHGAGQVELERLDERVAHTRVVPADVEHPEAAEQVEEAIALVVPEIRAFGARPGTVEPDRAQHARELRVDRARPEVEALAAARRDELGDRHLRTVASG